MRKKGQTFLIAIVFLAGVVFFSQAGNERVVHFPEDRSIGQLSIQDDSIVREIENLSFVDEWESFGQAKGDVEIPAGKRLALRITEADMNNLSALSGLAPDDLYMLTISGSSPSNPIEHPRPDDRCMPYISRLTGLKNLRLYYPDISAEGLRLLSNLESLEFLTLSGEITDESLAVVSELRTLKDLYILDYDLTDNRLTDEGLAYLAGLSLLEVLRIDGNRMTNAGLAHLAELPSLRYLILYGDNFTDAGMVHLKSIPSLQILHVGFLNLTDASIQHLADIDNLEDLNLSGSEEITDDGLAALAGLTSLKKLNIGSSKVTDKGLSYLRNLKNLEYLSLPSSGISDVGLTYIGELSNLKSLDVSRVYLVDPNMDEGYYTDKGVAELAKCTQLEVLNIGSLGLSDEGMSHIAKLTNLKRLLLFGCSNVTNEGLAKMATLKSLENLSVYAANITIGGLSCLNELSNLTNLNLRDVHQDDLGMDISGLEKLEDLTLRTESKRIDREMVYEPLNNSDLACLANLGELKRLQFVGVGIGDAGIKHLSGLKNLEILDIICPGEERITDEGIKYLTGLERLNQLCIKDGHITDKALEYLDGMPALTWLELTSDFAFSNKAMEDFQNNNPNITRLELMP